MRTCKSGPKLAGILLLLLSSALFLVSCDAQDTDPLAPVQFDGLELEERVSLSYADQFAIDRYKGGYSLISVSDGRRYLIVPPQGDVPENLGEDISVLRQPIQNIYLAATSVMGLFDELDSLETIRFSGAKAEEWYIENAALAMERGDMLYAGKYRDPDYEMILAENCSLAIESTMIEHVPEVQEKLEELGIVVFEERSSYESQPLGRSEWIKVYGEMVDKEEVAQTLFDKQKASLDSVASEEPAGKTVAFFYINSSGQVVTRKSGDYVTKMIELAGGDYVFQSLGDSDSATSTVTMEMEQFYTEAKDADIILYNSTIGGEIYTIEELVSKNKLLADFKAVQAGDVWCTQQNLYQESMKLGTVIADIHTVLTQPDNAESLQFMYRLERS